MNKIITLLLTLTIVACGGNSMFPSDTPAAAPEPPPSADIGEFCEALLSNVCARADKCGLATAEECLMTMAMQVKPCSQWTSDSICDPGLVYNGELGYKCVEQLPSLSSTCDLDYVPEACEVEIYCVAE
jgi:hypothetical protein